VQPLKDQSVAQGFFSSSRARRSRTSSETTVFAPLDPSYPSPSPPLPGASPEEPKKAITPEKDSRRYSEESGPLGGNPTRGSQDFDWIGPAGHRRSSTPTALGKRRPSAGYAGQGASGGQSYPAPGSPERTSGGKDIVWCMSVPKTQGG